MSLSAPERRELQAIVDGTGAAWRRRRAQILRMADEGRDGGNLRDVNIARGLGIGASTVERLRKRCVLEDLEAAFRRREQENRRPKLRDRAKEAKLVALAGSSPPEGCVRGTLKLLAGRRMEMEIVESISKETVRRTLKKEIKPWLKPYGCLPPSRNAPFVAAREEVRYTDQRDVAEDEVLICMDETRRQPTKETRLPRPVQPGQPEILDYEYERNGTAHLFLGFASNENWRTVNVTDRRTARDWAQFIRELADDPIPGKKIVRVMDHRNTHGPASLYEAFAPQEAMRVRKRFEFRYPPKYGSWLHRAEIEIGAWSRPCLR